MTFESREATRRAGAPVTLVAITYGGTTVHWTSGDAARTVDGESYTPMPLRISDLNQGSESGRTTLELVIPLSSPVAEFVLQPGSLLRGEVSVLVLTEHRGEDDPWVGFGGSVSQVQSADADEGTLTLVVERMDGMLRRECPRISVAQTCQNQLGDHLCRVNLDAFAFTTTIGTINLTDARRMTIVGITAEEGEDGTRFIGGVLWRSVADDWIVAGYILYRGSGIEIVLMDPNPDLHAGDPVKLYTACDRLITTCKARYDNVDNFTGLMPLGNPERSFMEGTGFLGFAVDETVAQGTTPDPAPRP